MVIRPDSFRYLPVLLLIPATCIFAQTEIHRCTQEDGTVAFQEMPCEEATNPSTKDVVDNDRDEADAPDSDDDVFDSPFDEPADPPSSSHLDPAVPISGDRAACEKSARDAIDAIDLEMREGSTHDERRQHLDELLELTRQLRDCKKIGSNRISVDE